MYKHPHKEHHLPPRNIGQPREDYRTQHYPNQQADVDQAQGVGLGGAVHM